MKLRNVVAILLLASPALGSTVTLPVQYETWPPSYQQHWLARAEAKANDAVQVERDLIVANLANNAENTTGIVRIAEYQRLMVLENRLGNYNEAELAGKQALAVDSVHYSSAKFNQPKNILLRIQLEQGYDWWPTYYDIIKHSGDARLIKQTGKRVGYTRLSAEQRQAIIKTIKDRVGVPSGPSALEVILLRYAKKVEELAQ